MEFKSKIIVALGILALAIVTYFTVNNSKEKDMSFSQVHARHILVDTEKEASDILNDIEAKKISFEEAAKQFSKCPSGKSGGDLGFFGKGMMVKEFEDSAFSLEIGKVSKPVKTQFGWHLIEVVEHK